ncbi:hypothetical protein IG631_13794 [Alternaria alternata]|nr:hypothetical protein IG631_13794 [Alternaria alternata]
MTEVNVPSDITSSSLFNTILMARRSHCMDGVEIPTARMQVFLLSGLSSPPPSFIVRICRASGYPGRFRIVNAHRSLLVVDSDSRHARPERMALSFLESLLESVMRLVRTVRLHRRMQFANRF